MIFTHVSTYGQVPYILTGDFNISVKGSPTLKAMLQSGYWHDLSSLFGDPSCKQATFCKQGVKVGDKVRKGATCIDHIFVNSVALHMVHSFLFLDSLVGMGTDHIALSVTLALPKAYDFGWFWMPPLHLPVEKFLN